MKLPLLLALSALCAFGSVPGTDLTTEALPSDLQVARGAHIRLSPRSSSTVFDDHIVLHSGSLQLSHFADYPVAIGSLQVLAADTGVGAEIHSTRKTVEIASLGGDVNITRDGALLTRVTAGTRVSFQQGTSAAPVIKNHGEHRHLVTWLIVGTAAAALVIGLIAASQGKGL